MHSARARQTAAISLPDISAFAADSANNLPGRVKDFFKNPIFHYLKKYAFVGWAELLDYMKKNISTKSYGMLTGRLKQFHF